MNYLQIGRDKLSQKIYGQRQGLSIYLVSNSRSGIKHVIKVSQTHIIAPVMVIRIHWIYSTGCPKKMFIKEMGQDRIFLNTPSFSMDKMRRI